MSTPSSPSSADKRLHALKHSRTLNSLADSIRSLRDSTPSESKSGPASPVTSPPSSPRFGGQLFNPNRHSPSASHDPPNSPSTTNRIEGKYTSRPFMSSSEDIAWSPKARFQAFMAPSSKDQSAQQPVASTSKALSSSPKSPSFLNKRTISSPVLQPTQVPRGDASPTPTRVVDLMRSPVTGPTAAPNVAPTVQPRSNDAEIRPHSAAMILNSDDSTDTASIIAKAGSAEAAVEQLVKERQAAVTRNEQLWQLVENQRTMILDLNRDLEMALKDKEKYWKRLKDQSEALKATLENGQSPRTSSDTQQTESQISSGSSRLLQNGLTRLATSTEQCKPSARQLNLPLTPESAESTDKHTNMSPTLVHGKLGSTVPRSLRQQPSSPKITRSESGLSLALSAGTVSPKPPVDSATASVEKLRKLPPKPLNLSGIALTAREAVVDSDSEYSEIDESDQSSWDERGRRPTREADDRQREVVVMKEQEERRSRSGKSKPVKSKPELADRKVNHPVEIPMVSYRGVDQPAKLVNGIGLPSSPRAPLLGGLQSPLHPSLSSIGSLLRPNDRPIPQRIVTAPILSPGLPATPRPGDRPINAPQPRMPVKAVKSMVSLVSESGMSLPYSSQNLQPFPASRFNISLPPLPSPSLHIDGYSKQSMAPSSLTKLGRSVNGDLGDSDPVVPSVTEITPNSLIFQGFVSEHYPNLLLPPNALPVIDVRVQSCRLMPLKLSRNGKEAEEDMPFTLGIYSRANGKQLWIVEKTIPALSMMEQAMKLPSASNVKTPDKSLFSGQSPAKIDARRMALNTYFQTLLDTAMDEKTALAICGFFSTDVQPPVTPDSAKSPTPTEFGKGNSSVLCRKEGYLSKKGKSFGGWKARYFVVAGTDVQYYETFGGESSGTINLQGAQIARQTSTSAEDAEYRHAFMVLEPKRKDSSSVNRHILCAETDEERDEWIEVLLPYTDASDNEDTAINAVESAGIAQPVANKSTVESTSSKTVQNRPIPLLQTVSYDSTQAAELPLFGGSSARASWSPASTDNASDSSSIAGRSSQTQVQASQLMPAKASPTVTRKKRSMFGFRTRASDDNVPPQPPLPTRSIGAINSPITPRDNPVRGVFGIPLAEAAEFHSPEGIHVTLPAPIYRCIEYLEQKHGAKEEGIFRLSGSNSTVKALKERFNNEGDVKLLDGEHYDVHAVASLLKLYLRELPESVLTRKLHLDFLRIIDAPEDHRQKVMGINILVHKLPEANHEILATLSRFLIDIVNNSDVNKMNVRNVGIVFSPTLNIPAPLISLFLTDYGAIFGSTDDLTPSPLIQDLTNGSATTASVGTVGMDSIRSPRKQLFTDLPTPSYAQNGFGSFMQKPLLFTNEQAQILREQAGPQAQDARTAYDSTGFMPLKQAYTTPGLTATALRLSAISNIGR